jgi:hypothetical protein
MEPSPRASLVLLGPSDGQWFDLGLRRVLSGTVYNYSLTDPSSGNWRISVRVSEQVGKSAVEAVPMDRFDSLHDQLRRKSITFNACRDRSKYYHPLGIAYDFRGRVSYARVDDRTTVPKYITNEYELDTYENVSPTDPGNVWRGKIVALVKSDQTDKMARLFYLEKILPIFG